MPIGAGVLIPAAAGVLSDGINAVTQIGQNRANRKFAQQQTQQARQWALQDYQSQNEYNSPAAQMERLKAAGLNPNLVYGTGAATQQAVPIKPTQKAEWRGEAPRVNLGQSAMAFMDAQMRQAQVDNLRVQNTVLLEEKKLKEAQTRATLANAGLSEFNLDYSTEVRGTRRDLLAANLANTEARTKSTIDSNERAAAMQAPSLLKAAETILTMRLDRSKTELEKAHIRQQIRNLKQDHQLKQMDIELGPGVKNSPWYIKLLADTLDNIDEYQKKGGKVIPKSFFIPWGQ